MFKKLFLMLFTVAAITACSDDDSNNGDDEKIVGTWFFSQANGIPSLELNDCNRDSFITFSSDKTTYSEYYTQTGEGCSLEEETESVWEVDGEIYTFTIPFQGLGEVNGTVSFNEEVDEFVFTPNAVPSASLVLEKR